MSSRDVNSLLNPGLKPGAALSAWQLAAILLCAGAVVLASGCGKNVVHAPSLAAAAASSRPRLPANRIHTHVADPGSPPNLTIPPPAPISLIMSRTPPHRTRNGSVSGQPAEIDPRPAPPQISPAMSPQEQATAEKQTNQSIAAAERDLQSALGRQLSPTQSDLVEKIREFLGQAREAIRNADWLRAKILAQKARVLSTELVNSL